MCAERLITLNPTARTSPVPGIFYLTASQQRIKCITFLNPVPQTAWTSVIYNTGEWKLPKRMKHVSLRSIKCLGSKRYVQLQSSALMVWKGKSTRKVPDSVVQGKGSVPIFDKSLNRVTSDGALERGPAQQALIQNKGLVPGADFIYYSFNKWAWLFLTDILSHLHHHSLKLSNVYFKKNANMRLFSGCLHKHYATPTPYFLQLNIRLSIKTANEMRVLPIGVTKQKMQRKLAVHYSGSKEANILEFFSKF